MREKLQTLSLVVLREFAKDKKISRKRKENKHSIWVMIVST